MIGQPEGQGKGVQRRGGFGTDNKDRSVPRMLMSVWKAMVKAIREGGMSHLVGELVRFGQPILRTAILRWESTTTAGILRGVLAESGASPLTQISHRSIALSRDVFQS